MCADVISLWDVCRSNVALSVVVALLDSNCIYIHVAVDHEFLIHIEVIVAVLLLAD